MKLSDLSVEQRLDLGERIRQMSDEAKREMAEELGEAGALELAYDPIIQLRPQQFLPPDPDKPIVLASCGRG